MTMTATGIPHGRWLLKKQVDRLAASHSDVIAAGLKRDRASERARTSAENRLMTARIRAATRTPLRRRIPGRRGWARTIGLVITVAASAVFLSWASERLIGRLAVPSSAVAALPGVLITLAVTAAASHCASAIRRGVLAWLAWVPVAAAVVAEAAWVALWLAVPAGASPWAAAVGGIVLAVATSGALLLCCYPAAPAPRDLPAITAGTPDKARPFRAPRYLRVTDRRTRTLLLAHSRKWNETAHAYGAALDEESPAAGVLASMLADDRSPAQHGGIPEGIDPFDTLILAALRRYHPASLAERLGSSAAALNGETEVSQSDD